ncbi:DUF6607 family protein [Kordiimonas aestuarii]|uniref:DUF6607 family protein n=1 Tax=Kordiimonas aestuarii TaxID=1005925 RepID=UPI0021CE6EAE|nr:DUF6607 family protein [Kordiimonas aestuarii]
MKPTLIKSSLKLGAVLCTAFMLAACNTTSQSSVSMVAAQADTAPTTTAEKFEADRKAILAMAGDYKVKFDFQETVSFKKGYEPKERYVTGAHEMVRVIDDTGEFISLQHILVVGDGDEVPFMPIKHWRQDWQFQPTEIMDFVGANTWVKRDVSLAERAGKWSQTVYQVDDAPRYAAVAAWDHSSGAAVWTSPKSWRPLPRRDATKRDDYHAIAAVNRHAITPNGWVHEQDNAKLVLGGEQPALLVHEIGVNTYEKFDGFKTEIGTEYWAKTKGYWKAIRDEWNDIFAANTRVGLTIQGEPAELYMQILGIATDVEDGKKTDEEAASEAIAVLQSYITTNPASVRERLHDGETTESSEAYSR